MGQHTAAYHLKRAFCPSRILQVLPPLWGKVAKGRMRGLLINMAPTWSNVRRKRTENVSCSSPLAGEVRRRREGGASFPPYGSLHLYVKLAIIHL